MNTKVRSSFRELSRLWCFIGKKRRFTYGFLVCLMTFVAFVEMMSIGAILPLISAILEPNSQSNSSLIGILQNYFPALLDQSKIFVALIVFCSLNIFVAIMRLAVLWVNITYSQSVLTVVSDGIYSVMLHQNYKEQIERHSSVVIDVIVNKAGLVVQGLLYPSLVIVNGVLIFFAVFAFLAYLSPGLAISSVLFFGGCYLFVISKTKALQYKNGEKIANCSSLLIKTIQDGIGYVREIILDSSQNIYLQKFSAINQDLQKSRGLNQFLLQSPRIYIEALGILFIAIVIFYGAREDGQVNTFGIVGVLGLASQRLLPIMQQVYGAWSAVIGSQSSVEEALNLLDDLSMCSDLDAADGINFIKSFSLDNISYSHSKFLKPTLDAINCEIIAGDRIGIIGKTGSGKSTLLDVIMALLQPTSGFLVIDGVRLSKSDAKSWQKLIAHVPQSIFLTDASLAENIAMTTKANIDFERLNRCAKLAQLNETIDELPNGVDTSIGERGVQISGGQRQRIGIARALYKEAKIIILDEATSALDSDTEEDVMAALQNLGEGVTIIMVAHRLTTLKGCNKIFEIEGGEIRRKGTYEYIVQPILDKDRKL